MNFNASLNPGIASVTLKVFGCPAPELEDVSLMPFITGSGSISISCFLMFLATSTPMRQPTNYPPSRKIQKKWGGIAPSPIDNLLLSYGVVMGNGLASTQADEPPGPFARIR